MTAIEKINTEMQKKASDKYTEIIGQYIIDRCVDPAVAEKVEKGPGLADVMKKITDLAKTKKSGSVAVLTPAEVFGVVDKYYGIGTDKEAQFRAVMDEASAQIPVPYKTEEKTEEKPKKLSLSDFL